MALRRLDYNFLVLLVGDLESGTHNIIHSFLNERQDLKDRLDSYGPGKGFEYKRIQIDNKEISLFIRSGFAKDDFLDRVRPFKIHGIMLVYSVTSKSTFEHLEMWIKKIENQESFLEELNPNCMILVGNNCERENERQISKERGEKFAQEKGIAFFEVDSFCNKNIDEAFFSLTRSIVSDIGKDESTKKETTPLKDSLQKDSLHKEPQHKEKGESFLKKWLRPILRRQEKTRSVPQEIEQDPYAKDLYEKALQFGKEKDMTIRVNIVGNYRQGKTTLMRRILNQPIDDVESTNGIVIKQFDCFRGGNGKLTYTEADPIDNETILQRLVKVALSESGQIPEKTYTPSSEHKTEGKEADEHSNEVELNTEIPSNTTNAVGTYNVIHSKPGSNAMAENNEEDTQQSKTDLEQKFDAKVAMLTLDQKRKFEKEIRGKETVRSANGDQASFKFWDFGGQFVFYATHALFHSRKAIYILVFDLSIPLSQTIIDEDFPLEQELKTMADYIEFWMNSIHSFVGSNDGKEPVVLLVGTHKDKIPGSEVIKNKYVQKYFQDIRELLDYNCLINHIYPQDFAVNNQTSKDQVVNNLRNTILEIGEAISCTIEIPAKWIQLEKSLNEKTHLKIIKFEQIEALDSTNEYPLGSKEQIKIFLHYHHSKGTYIYFDEFPISEYVIVDPQFLVDAFKSIITSGRFCTNDPEERPLWKRLRSEAILEKSLIYRQWDKAEDGLFLEYKEILLVFLSKHHIISEASEYDEDTNTSLGLGWYIVPSLLSEMSDQKEVAEFQKSREQTLVRFTMKFENSAIVAFVFQRLIAALIARWPVAQLRTRSLLFKNLCIVRLNCEYAGVTEIKHDSIDLFLVKLCSSSERALYEQADCLRRFAESIVKHEFRKLKVTDECKTVPYTVCFRCNHFSHGLSGCLKVLEVKQLDAHSKVPCPDLENHEINTKLVKAEWYTHLPLHHASMNIALNEQTLGKISQCIGSNWQLLGLELGLTQVQIDHITEDYPNSTVMKIYCMLRAWRRKAENAATMINLFEAMKKCPCVSIDWDEIQSFAEQL